MKAYTLVTAPATEPVSLADVKTYLRIDNSADDAVLTILIAACRRSAEEYTKRAFISQTWQLTMDRFGVEIVPPPGFHVAPTPFLVDGSQTIQLSRQPIQSITSIKTTDSANAETIVSTATYALDKDAGRVLLNSGYSWPTSLRANAAVKILFVAGYGDAAATVPEPIKQGILQHVAASYTAKVCGDIPEGSKSAYDAFRLAEAFGAF
ncbi:head-tail connector protein [Mesorhizobium sp. ES1-1]|uniref:head-tail connector protein n=1 Tax=Mesorhizobium sp. ES1-1 TaxID=2876629 RepID=UPI001CCE23DE|nr:head-tail connector protein [Mesorhizobium sp. ES1-1]MBZ9674548.1 head-tail connector protein [Mesorhizobium sp. ES1-1]